MEEAATPKTKKATIEWLRTQLDEVQVSLVRCQQKNEELYKALEDKSDEIHFLSRDLVRIKQKLAEERAWAEIALDESEAVRKSFHGLLTNLELERL